jgi:hypothetical protein
LTFIKNCSYYQIKAAHLIQIINVCYKIAFMFV